MQAENITHNDTEIIVLITLRWKKQNVNRSLGYHKAENYHDMFADLVQSYKDMGCHMLLKVHFLDCHL
jgi:hypothetical protein